MKRLKVIFVSQDGLMHQLVSEVVLAGTHSDKDFAGHAALFFPEVNDPVYNRKMKNVIFEAVQPLVHFDLDGNKFDKDTKKCVIEIEISDERYQKAVDMALRLEGRKYGLVTDCLATFIKDNFDIDATKVIDCGYTFMCSECVGLVFMNMFSNFYPTTDMNTTSPIELCDMILNFIDTEPEIKLVSIIEG